MGVAWCSAALRKASKSRSWPLLMWLSGVSNTSSRIHLETIWSRTSSNWEVSWEMTWSWTTSLAISAVWVSWSSLQMWSKSALSQAQQPTRLTKSSRVPTTGMTASLSKSLVTILGTASSVLMLSCKDLLPTSSVTTSFKKPSRLLSTLSSRSRFFWRSRCFQLAFLRQSMVARCWTNSSEFTPWSLKKASTRTTQATWWLRATPRWRRRLVEEAKKLNLLSLHSKLRVRQSKIEAILPIYAKSAKEILSRKKLLRSKQSEVVCLWALARPLRWIAQGSSGGRRKGHQVLPALPLCELSKLQPIKTRETLPYWTWNQSWYCFMPPKNQVTDMPKLNFWKGYQQRYYE